MHTFSVEREFLGLRISLLDRRFIPSCCLMKPTISSLFYCLVWISSFVFVFVFVFVSVFAVYVGLVKCRSFYVGLVKWGHKVKTFISFYILQHMHILGTNLHMIVSISRLIKSESESTNFKMIRRLTNCISMANFIHDKDWLLPNIILYLTMKIVIIIFYLFSQDMKHYSQHKKNLPDIVLVIDLSLRHIML